MVPAWRSFFIKIVLSIGRVDFMLIDEARLVLVKKILLILGVILILFLTVTTLLNYPGDVFIYLLFSIVSSVLLVYGFRKNAIFFDAFIGVFFWIGFWLKFSVRVSFANGLFHESVGGFDGSGNAFDRSLLVTVCGFAGLLLASYMREKLFFKYPFISKVPHDLAVVNFYVKFRTHILIIFFLAVLLITLLNMLMGVYQKGSIARTSLPFGFNGVFKWLLLFGFASFSAIILKLEISSKRGSPYLVAFISLFENFFTNVSLLSRGMILNFSALMLGVLVEQKMRGLKVSIRFVAIGSCAFLLLFFISIFSVNFLRQIDFQKMVLYQGGGLESVASNIGRAKPLILDRWVGIEGVMAVSSSSKIGWDLWRSAWAERYNENVMAFYDANLITSPYQQTDFTKHHHISLPGILAFFFYPGSFVFLFFGMFGLGLMAAVIEICTFHMGKENLILCSLIAEVVAYRFASFGYVPIQSYLLFGTIFLNLLIVYFIYKAVSKWASIGNKL
jgi:hypothetical protein